MDGSYPLWRFLRSKRLYNNCSAKGYATMMYLPARTGTVLIGEDVKFIETLFVPLRRKTDFREVVFLVIGECPIIVNLWQGGRGFTADKVKMAKHYGSHYIVAYSRSGTLFGMTFNKDAWNLLIKKCPGAQIFEKEADFLEFIREQKPVFLLPVYCASGNRRSI